MALTETTAPRQTRLTTVGAVKRELGLGAEADPVLAPLVDAASAACERYCARPFARAVLTETLAGYGDLILQLARTPIVAVSTVTMRGDPITDYTIEDRDAGWLSREAGWWWTASRGQGWSDYVIPRSEQPWYTVAYTAGYLLPADDLVSADLSVAAADQSFNLASGAFPLLVAGDRITSSAFVTAANNGTWTVVSRTATKVIVSEAGMVNESASPDPKTLTVSTLPADVEKAAIETTKAWYRGATRDPQVAEKRVGDLSIRYSGAQGGASYSALPMTATSLLAPWVRVG